MLAIADGGLRIADLLWTSECGSRIELPIDGFARSNRHSSINPRSPINPQPAIRNQHLIRNPPSAIRTVSALFLHEA
jgi:hypothetical protein